jgi:flavin reductase (DIM6/NTAB) family NADH-FMN oxidoreductase RutF
MQKKVDVQSALARKYPESISVAVARDANGRHNPITLGWVMSTSIEPPMLAISIGQTRHSLAALRHARAFVVSFLSAAMARDALYHGSHSGRDVDKLEACGTRTQPASRIDSVLLADAVANFECELVSEHPTGDHVIFVGRIVAAHVHQDPDLGRLYSLGNEQMGGVRPA